MDVGICKRIFVAFVFGSWVGRLVDKDLVAGQGQV